MSGDRHSFEIDVPREDGDFDRKRITVDARDESEIPIAEQNAADGAGRIHVDEPDGYTYDDELPRLPIPGTGEPIGPDDETEQPACGETEPLMFCTDCGEPAMMASNCGRARCPTCWERWAFRSCVTNPMNGGRARGTLPKMEQFRLDERDRGNGRRIPGTDLKGPFFQHTVVSLANRNVRFRSKDPLKKAQHVVVGLLKAAGLENMIVIYHPWRIVYEHRGEVRGHDSGDGDKNWKDIPRLIGEYGWEYVRDEYLSFEPHFHVLGVGEVDTSITPAIEDATGIVVHRITSERNPNVSIYGLEDLARTAAYCYSHAGIRVADDDGGNDRVAAEWFGRRIRNTSPSAYAVKESDEAMREVAYDVLGVSFDKPECRVEHPTDDCGCGDCASETETDDAPIPTPRRAIGARSSTSSTPTTRSSGSASAIVADGGTDLERPVRADTTDVWAREAETASDLETEPCGGGLASMFIVDDYLECGDWAETIPDGTLERLREARERHREVMAAPDAVAAPGEPPDAASAD